MAESNVNSRLEAFCEGVFANALTLLIIGIVIPSSETLSTTNDLWLALQLWLFGFHKSWRFCSAQFGFSG